MATPSYRLVAILFGLGCVCSLFPEQLYGQGFTIGNYEVLSSTRVGRTTFDYVMRATITNNTLAAQGVAARVVSTSTNTIIIQNVLNFGDLAAGGVAVSTNTFTIRQERLVPFAPSALQWTFQVQSMALTITIDSPVSGLLTNGTNIVVSGTVGPAVSAVTVNSVTATLTGSSYTATVELREGKNTLSAVARNPFGGGGSASVIVNRDTTPPIVIIESPSNGAVLSSSQLTVGGLVNDVVSGTVNADQATVTVNGIAAGVVNRSYAVPEILLARGKNKITAVARDRAGNESQAQVEVIYQEAVAQKRIVVVGGNNQSGLIGSTLPEPLLIALLDANGAAVTNQSVVFTVVRNDGVVKSSPNQGRQITVLTDDKGLASVLFQLGTRTGAGNNQVAATSSGVPGETVFCASAMVAPPARINALLPETQVGETGQPLPEPWIAYVTDAGGNPVAGVAVSFMVFQGDGGTIDGTNLVTKTTSSDGRASVLHTLGMEEGINNNVVVALIPGLSNAITTFKASARTAQRPQDTRVVGLVLDHVNRPMSNIFCGIFIAATGTRLTAITDRYGQFILSNAPVGAARLFVDARNRGYPGTWELLEFDLVTVAGRDNSVDRPIYMLPLDEEGSAIVGGDQDVTLHLKGLPGAEMTIFAHSVRDANGQPITERVMFTQVNQERLPMPPPLGSRFMLAWTVQPAGVRFDPPARMCIPNTGLAPGQVMEMFSFDHDLVQFSAIGTATVSADGAQICSDPGFGVMKSGWGGAIPPPPPCTAICGPAPMDTDCVHYEAIPAAKMCDCPTYKAVKKDGGPCDDKNPCTINDMCKTGVCKGDKIEIFKVEGKANGTNELVTATNTVINFTAEVMQTNCSSLTYQWDFGDGMSAATQNPMHTYTSAGLFNVKVTVRCAVCPTAMKEGTLKVLVTGLNLIVHKPKVIDAGETAIPDADELTKGSQTFVNLDNDDQDMVFDTGTADSDNAAENEMIKIKLQLTNKDVKTGKVKLEATAGGGDIKVWKKANKMTEYVLGSDLIVPGDFMVQGSVLEAILYVEGIAPHTSAQATKLKMTYDQTPMEADEVAVTVIGIESISWEGINNSTANNNALDADPTWPMGLAPGSLRVFPDARLEGIIFSSPGDPRDKVNVKATLSVVPIESVNVFFRSFDVDDPTAAAAPVDDDTGAGSDEDNRGTAPAKAGKITGSDGTGVVTVLFDVKEKTFEFQTTMQPGDNFRVVGSGDKSYLADVGNDERALGPNNDDKQRIVNQYVTGTPVQRELRDAAKYASQVLTVWRFLHIEQDSMGVVVNNFQEGNITALDTGDSTTAKIVTVNNSPRDGSNDQNTGTNGNGRYERGTLLVAGTHSIMPLDSNGQNDLRRAAGLNVCATPLPFVAADNDFFPGSTLAGTVTAISGGSLVLTLNITAHSETPIDWPDFVGGTLEIGGGPIMNITAVNSNTSQVTVDGLLIPYRVTDDDAISGDVPQPDVSGMAPIWAAAYVLPVFDTGEDSPSVTFVLNSADADQVAHIQSGKGIDLSVNKFWAVTVLNAYQTGTANDNDPDGEGTDRAVSHFGVHGVIMTLESIRDWTATPLPLGGNGADPAVAGRQTRYQEILNHEVGHQFGHLHPDGGVTAADPLGGVEAPSCCPPDMPASGTRGASTFTQIGLDRIRSRGHPGN